MSASSRTVDRRTFASFGALALVGLGGPARADGATPTPRMTSAKSVGHTSLTFRVDYEDGSRRAVKPRSRKGGRRYRGEIATYRLARALGLDIVPEVLAVRTPLAELKEALLRGSGRAAEDPERGWPAVVSDRGITETASIAWVDGLAFSSLDGEAERSRIVRWNAVDARGLGDGGAPDEARRFGPGLAAMVLLDCVTGNWDRWSGGNVGFVKAGGRVVAVDNDGAFFDPAPAGPTEVSFALAARLHFPPDLVGKVTSMDRPTFDTTFGDDSDGTPLLTPSTIESAWRRLERVRRLVGP